MGAQCAQHGSPSCRRCLQLGWGINRCCRAGHKGHTAPGQAPPPAATGTRPASAGTGGPPGGGKRALGMAGAGQTGMRSAAGAREALAPGGWNRGGWPSRRPHPTATWCPRPDVRAERRPGARRAGQRQVSPPPSPQGTAALGLHDVLCSISAAVLTQGGTGPRPHCGPKPPPSPQGRQGRQVKRGRVQGHKEQRTVHSTRVHQQHTVQRTAHSTTTVHMHCQQRAPHTVHHRMQHTMHHRAQHTVHHRMQHTEHHTMRHTLHHRMQHKVHHRMQHTVHHTMQHMAQHTAQVQQMQHTSQHTVQHIVQHTAQHTVQHARHAGRRAQDDWGPCARPTFFPWVCPCGSPLRRIAPLGRPTL